MIQIPLSRKGRPVGQAIVDEQDAGLAELRWHIHKGYVRRAVSRSRHVYLHREVLGLAAYDGLRQADHVNGDKLDCRRSNLRVVDRSTNQHNRAGKNAGASAACRGVYWMPGLGKFKAQLSVNRRRVYLGLFATRAEAEASLLAKRRELGLPLDRITA